MQRRDWLWMITLLLLAFALGVRMLQADILWFDEAKTVYFNGARHFGPLSLAGVWNNLAENDPWQSPGYYLLLDLWADAVGWSDFAARSLSLFIGMVALAWLYRLGRDMLNSRIGIFAAAVLVGSSLYIHYLHEMRPYALYVLMTCLSIWAYWRILSSKAEPVWRFYVALFIGLAGLAYTHIFALLTAFGIGVYHLLLAPKNRRWFMTCAVMLLAALS
ncbi:MAG: glycosyltransferase family 39 protein, partial [Acidobacteriales bacterium]|nr:glycosyltransferase family 39 protein [Terriglobales bacterium]